MEVIRLSPYITNLSLSLSKVAIEIELWYFRERSLAQISVIAVSGFIRIIPVKL